MAPVVPVDESLPSKRARNPPPPPPSAAPPLPRVKRKRVPTDQDDEGGAAGARKATKDNAGGKLVQSASMAHNGSAAGTPVPGGPGGSGIAGQVGDEPKRESKLDFVAFPSEALQSYLLNANIVPLIEPSPYSDLPAPLPNTLYNRPSNSNSHASSLAYPYNGNDSSSHVNGGDDSLAGRNRTKKPRTAILADVQAAHEVFAGAAKEHWEKTGGAGSGGIREGDVVTGFLYRCRVGDRVLKVVPPS